MAELFADSFVDRDPRWPILAKLTSASLVLHAAALALLLYVPGVRDAFNIAQLLTNTGYVDSAYSKTEIGEDVTVLNLANKFRYPPGYFATEADLALAQAQANPVVVETNRRVVEPESAPSRSPEASPSPSPDLAASANATETAADKEPKTPEQADQELDRMAKENNIVRPSENDINKRPLKDWLEAANQMREKKEIDLNSTVELTILATMGQDCKFRDAVVVQKSGDDRLVQVAKDMASAINDSNALSILRDPAKQKADKSVYCEPSPLKLILKLDDSAVTARFELEADSQERAAQLANVYNGLLVVGAIAAKSKNKVEEATLYQNTKVTPEGKQIVLNFSMPRQTASEMLKKQLPSPPSG